MKKSSSSEDTEPLTMVFRCRKCGHTELREGHGPHICHVITKHKNLFSAGEHEDICGGEMEEECQSTDLNATSVEEQKKSTGK